MISKDTLIYDLETASYGDKPDGTKDKLRVFGAYSYLTNRYHTVTSTEAMRKLMIKHKVFVGFNNISYDNPVLHYNGFSDLVSVNKYGDGRIKGKTCIDLMAVIKERCSQMKIKKGMLGDLLMSFSLDYITKMLDLVDEKQGKIKDFDYDLLKKDTWTTEEAKLIKEYTERDIEITKKLYEWIEDYFDSFKHYVPQKDIDNKSYINDRFTALAYKAICFANNWRPEYGDHINKEDQVDTGGGYVSYPKGERFDNEDGDIYCLDFNSLYPFIMIMMNLYGRMKSESDRPIFTDDRWKTNGKYHSDIMADVCKQLLKWYKERKVLKAEGDRREYSLKIFINIVYGLLKEATYSLVYDVIANDDCPRVGRQWVQFARDELEKAGYFIIYTDTDSVYIKDPFKDYARMMKVKDSIIKEIKAHVPFPEELFDMGDDGKIEAMFFFKGKSKDTKELGSKEDFEYTDDDVKYKHLGLMKKNYIYIELCRDKDGNETGKKKLVFKNLGVKKKSNSALSRKIFRDIMIPKILETKQVKFSKTFIRNAIQKLIDEDINIITVRYKVNGLGAYKNTSSIQAQISARYGRGIHFLIPNLKVGVGKGKVKKCTMKEFKEANLKVSDIVLDNVYRELGYFTKPTQKVNLGMFI